MVNSVTISKIIQNVGCNNILYKPDTMEVSSKYWQTQRCTVSEVSETVPTLSGVKVHKLTEDITNGEHYLNQNIGMINGNQYTFSVYAKQDSARSIFHLRTVLNGVNSRGNFDLSNGTVSGFLGGGGVTGGITSVGSGWYRLHITFTSGVPNGLPAVRLQLMDNTTYVYQGDGESGVLIAGAQFEEGSLTPYQTPYEHKLFRHNLFYDQRNNAVKLGTNISSVTNVASGRFEPTFSNNMIWSKYKVIAGLANARNSASTRGLSVSSETTDGEPFLKTTSSIRMGTRGNISVCGAYAAFVE